MDRICCICSKKVSSGKSGLQSIFIKFEDGNRLSVAQVIEKYTRFESCDPDNKACKACIKLTKDALSFHLLIEESYANVGSFSLKDDDVATNLTEKRSALNLKEEIVLEENNTKKVTNTSNTNQFLEYEAELEIIKGEPRQPDETLFVATLEPQVIIKEDKTTVNTDIKPPLDSNVKTKVETTDDEFNDFSFLDEPMNYQTSETVDKKASEPVVGQEATKPVRQEASKPVRQEASEQLYTEAILETVNSSNKDNRCSVCDRTFSSRNHLKRHMQSTHIKSQSFVCPDCPKTFSRSDNLRKHVKVVHNPPVKHKCAMCRKSFIKEDALKKHVEDQHTNVVPEFECLICKKTFFHKSFLEKHLLFHDRGEYACRHCDERFKEHSLLKEHQRTHSDAKSDFLCSFCGESFTRNDYLKVHLRRHMGEKPFKCRFCEKRFICSADVNVHEKYHTDIKPKVCSFCGRGFHRACTLTKHLRTHTGERPYPCTHCPKRFAQSGDLKEHIRRHTGERFKCEHCNASFLLQFKLRKHYETAHGIYIAPKVGRLNKVSESELATSEKEKTDCSNKKPKEVDALAPTKKKRKSANVKRRLPELNTTDDDDDDDDDDDGGEEMEAA